MVQRHGLDPANFLVDHKTGTRLRCVRHHGRLHYDLYGDPGRDRHLEVALDYHLVRLLGLRLPRWVIPVVGAHEVSGRRLVHHRSGHDALGHICSVALWEGETVAS